MTSAEYQLNPGLSLVKPQTAWAAGATGQGITVAVIDSGVVTGTHDLDGRISSSSVDIVASRNQPSTSRDQHGTMVAGFIASNFNNRGTVGVAFNATILSIRADEIGPCGSEPGAPPDDECGFKSSDISNALDYATTHGARVVNMSLGGDSPFGASALLRATNAGLVVVASAGNADDGAAADPNPSWPARFAPEAQFNGQIIAVGALNAAGNDIASYSFRAGVTQNFYLLAPGTNVWSGCGLPSPSTPGQTVCYSGSGTSFAAPVVSGAAALLMSAYPNLNAHDIVDILLRSARDMGPAGPDAVYGRGALDIDRAFQPIGTFSLPTPGGLATIADDVGSNAILSSALGDALVRSDGLATVGFDEYHREFRINLGAAFRESGRRSAAIVGASPIVRNGVAFSTPDGAQLRIASLQSPVDASPLVKSGLDYTDRSIDVAASYAKGGVRFDLWSGHGGSRPAFDSAEADAFSNLAQASNAVRAGYVLGRWTFSAESGQGDRGMARTMDLMSGGRARDEAASRYGRFLMDFRGDGISTTLGFGRLDEPGGPLGGFARPGSQLAMPATSQFVSLKSRFAPLPYIGVTAEAALGRTEARGQTLALSRAMSSSWRIEAVADCRLFRIACSGLSFEIAQPVRVESGILTALLADQPDQYLGPLSYSSRRLSLAPSGREIDLRMSMWRPLGPGGFKLEGAALLDEGHRADAPLNLGISAGWNLRF